MDQIRVGIVGVGLMGSLFARLAHQLPEARLVGVADVDCDRACALGRELAVPAFGDYQELLALPGLDAVVITTPDSLHREPAVAAARAGKHVMVEKPLATTCEDAQHIVDACRKENVVLMTAHVLRFDPSYGEAFQAVRHGKLGEIVHTASRRTTSLPDGKRRAATVSITYFLGSHEVDALQWIVGSPIVEVTSIAVSKVMASSGAADAVASLLRFRNGAIGTLETSYIRPPGPAAREIASYLVLTGTDGAYRVQPSTAGATLFQTDRTEPAAPAYSFDASVFGPINSIYRDEMAHFLECVRYGRTPIVTPEQAISSVRVCSAIEESLMRKTSVTIEQENIFHH